KEFRVVLLSFRLYKIARITSYRFDQEPARGGIRMSRAGSQWRLPLRPGAARHGSSGKCPVGGSGAAGLEAAGGRGRGRILGPRVLGIASAEVPAHVGVGGRPEARKIGGGLDRS